MSVSKAFQSSTTSFSLLLILRQLFSTDIPENCSSASAILITFFSKIFPLLSSRTLLPLLYRSCCIFHIGCWVAIHCPIVLTFFLFLQFLRFRCKKEVDTARSDACFSVVDFPHFLFHSLHIQTCGGSRRQVDLSSKLKKQSRGFAHTRTFVAHNVRIEFLSLASVETSRIVTDT